MSEALVIKVTKPEAIESIKAFAKKEKRSLPNAVHWAVHCLSNQQYRVSEDVTVKKNK